MTEAKITITSKERERNTLSLDDRYEAVTEAFVMSEDVKESSRQTYRESMKRFFRWMQDTGRRLNAMTTADILEYKKSLITSTLSDLTVRSYLVAVRRFYSWAERSGLHRDIARTVRSPKKNVCLEDEDFLKMDLSEDECVRLLRYFKERSKRDYAIVNLMLRMGLRTIEVVRLNVGWIRMVNGQRRLQVWRKGMDRASSRVTLGLTEPAWKPIQEYLQERDEIREDQPLFLTEGYGAHGNGKDYKPHANERMSTRLVQMIIKKGLRAIGLDSHEYSAHSLRHTCAVMMLIKGASMNDIQRQLGHASPNTTMIYLKSLERRQRMETSPARILDDSFNI